MSQLGIEQTDDMTPRTKRPRLGVDPGVTGQLRHQMVGNQIAELPQECETTARWLGIGFVLHGLPCGRSSRLKPTSFSPQNPKPIHPVGLQCNLIYNLARYEQIVRLQLIPLRAA